MRPKSERSPPKEKTVIKAREKHTAAAGFLLPPKWANAPANTRKGTADPPADATAADGPSGGSAAHASGAATPGAKAGGVAAAPHRSGMRQAASQPTLPTRKVEIATTPAPKATPSRGGRAARPGSAAPVQRPSQMRPPLGART